MSWHLRVDPIACTAHGLCAELLPESVALDEWGYPITTPVRPDLLPLARRAVADCPTLALRLDRARDAGGVRGDGR
jgi:ferredoxin